MQKKVYFLSFYCYRILLFVLLILNSIQNWSNSTFNHESIRFSYITSIEGLSNNTVYAITQDQHGYIWIGTREGLNKFDGHKIISYYNNENPNSIPGNFITSLLVSTDGKLIVGTTNGIAIYCPEFDYFIQIKNKSLNHSQINNIKELSNGEILIASFDGIFLLDKHLELKFISDEIVRDICDYRKGLIWAASSSEIIMMNYEGEIIKRYNNISENYMLDMSLSNIQCIFRDSGGKIWIGTERNGLWYYDVEKNDFQRLEFKEGINPLEDNFVRTINEDKFGNLWIGTESGLYIYDPIKTDIYFYGHNFNVRLNGLNDKAIYDIFKSKDNVMWVGTYFGGVNYSSPYFKSFYRIYADGGNEQLSGNALSEIIETKDGKIWIATEDGGINIFDPEKGSFEYIRHNPKDPTSINSNNVHALREDSEGNIWIGTFIGGLNRYNRKTGRIENVKLHHPVSSITQHVFSVFIDSRHRTWVGAISGLYLRESLTGEFHLFKPGIFPNNFIYDINEDKTGNLWICTYLNGIFRLDSNLTKVTWYRSSDTKGMLSDRILYVYPDSENLIWFGTMEGGLLKYDPKLDQFISFTLQDGLPNNTIYAITEDHSGDIWLSTNRGLSRFLRSDEKFQNFSTNDGLVGNQFNFRSALTASDGVVYFGAVNGLTYFTPEHISQNSYLPSINFTDLKLFNNSAQIGEESIIDRHINYLDDIELKYKHKSITLEFVAINYLSAGNTEYAYYLEGLEKDWNYVGSQNHATYTSLSPGKYTFHIKASSGDGIWGDNIRTLEIYVRPPFWFSIWGIMIYILIFVLSFLLYIRYLNLRQRERMDVQMAVLEKEKNDNLNKQRLSFFTNISHEFKTPLTLIIAAQEKFLASQGLLPQNENYGNVIKKNAYRLLFLINQLMDFRKIESDHDSLRLNKGDIIGYIKSVFDSFDLLMSNKKIEGVFSTNLDSHICYFDADKIEKIITNLLINSCNSYERPGKLYLDLKAFIKQHNASPSHTEGQISQLNITIKDEGKGLSSKKLEKIFEPFYSEPSKDIPGTGIGLTLVKSLVDFLNGHISLKSFPDKGTTFIIQLPLIHKPSPEFLKDDSFIDSFYPNSIHNETLLTSSESVFQKDYYQDGSIKKYEVHIVEDNKELTFFLNKHFSAIFKVTVSYDGLEAWEKIKKNSPDIIISDLIMPKMSGIELCNKIKESIKTCHIPVILLTAKSGSDSRIEGLTYGADVYIEKPFNLKELDLQVRNLIKAKESIRLHFKNSRPNDYQYDQLCNKDQILIKSITDVVYTHLDNNELNVDFICRNIGMSRTSLHTKLKKITGLSIMDFINNIRLQEALKMLEHGSFSVSEISYKVGFNDPAYFSRAFRKMHNKTPSQFRKKKQKLIS